jgi:histidinol-phosphate/aromatic aminotransferase/cobyric acid decarboxylase-like protein
VDWAQLARRSLAALEPYDPDASRDELISHHGLDALAPLNWNEDLFGQPAEVLDAAWAEVEGAPLYPERAYSNFRAAVAESIDVPAATVARAPWRPGADRGVAGVFVDPGTPVVIPQPTYGRRRRRPGVRPRGDRRGRPASGRPGSCSCATPTTRLLIARAEWEDCFDRLPEGCAVIADEACIDFADLEVRVHREQDVLASRSVIEIRSFSKVFGVAALRLG